MSLLETPSVATVEHSIPTPRGNLFARQWRISNSENQERLGQTLAPIVLMHESLGCAAMWRRFPEILCQATGRDVIAYDRLGFGQSAARHDVLPHQFIEQEALTDFSAVRQHLSIDRFALFGHSVGGPMAIHTAAHFPNACEALMTEAAQAFVEARTIAGIQQAQQAFAKPDQMERLTRYHGDKTAWVLNAWIDTWLHPDFADWSISSALPHVQCPSLVMHGSEDEYGSTEHPQIIAQGIAGPARLEVLPNRHHIPHLEAPEIVVKLVADFLRDLPTA